jgi:hypothetical protein
MDLCCLPKAHPGPLAFTYKTGYRTAGERPLPLHPGYEVGPCLISWETFV